MSRVFLFLYLLVGIFDSYASEHQKSRFFKVFLIPLLSIYALLIGKQIISFLGAGLASGWIGDILLIHKSKLRMKAGTFLFLLGHVFYTCWFILQIDPRRLSIWLVLISTTAYFLAGILLEKGIMYDQMVEKKIGSIIYMAAIGLMSWCSFLAAFGNGSFISWAGTIFFIVSDSLILDQTVHHKPQKAVMPTYLMAQLLIVLGGAA